MLAEELPGHTHRGHETACTRHGTAVPGGGPFLSTSRTGELYSLILLSALVLILYGRVLEAMAQQWWSDPNYGHGFLVPVFAAYILWRERDGGGASSHSNQQLGIPIMLFAIGLLILGTLASEHFTARISMLFLISGIIVFLAGLAGASVGRVPDGLSLLHDSACPQLFIIS